ncbi:hypothetical protein OG625_00285 [Streptomyces sp. NBC_01351]|uniref:hypothetical protein n=1 Tax=Streptomyces sp. NBC_01351 TaxID=2903833 RepID=UPI002E31B0F3|nr:hypothetical protein [Streptomyces sp. NBC_01351]
MGTALGAAERPGFGAAGGALEVEAYRPQVEGPDAEGVGKDGEDITCQLRCALAEWGSAKDDGFGLLDPDGVEAGGEFEGLAGDAAYAGRVVAVARVALFEGEEPEPGHGCLAIGKFDEGRLAVLPALPTEDGEDASGVGGELRGRLAKLCRQGERLPFWGVVKLARDRADHQGKWSGAHKLCRRGR